MRPRVRPAVDAGSFRKLGSCGTNGAVAGPNVWTLLTNEEDIGRAHDLLAAAIGAHVDPDVLLAQLHQLSHAFITGKDTTETAKRIMMFVGSLTGVARATLALLADLAEDEDADEIDEEKRRQIQLGLLEGAVMSLRANRDDNRWRLTRLTSPRPSLAPSGR